MKSTISMSACPALLLLFMAFAQVSVADDNAAKEKVTTTDVMVQDLKLKVPSNWKKEESPSRMRLATYSTPTVGEDKDRGELTIFSFPGGGGEVGQNLDRWVKQFSPDGRTAKITKGKAGDDEYYMAQISGTFNKSVGPPIMRKTKAMEGYRMMGVILTLEGKGVYFLKLSGPEASIKAQAKVFRASFGGSAESETDYEI